MVWWYGSWSLPRRGDRCGGVAIRHAVRLGGVGAAGAAQGTRRWRKMASECGAAAVGWSPTRDDARPCQVAEGRVVGRKCRESSRCARIWRLVPLPWRSSRGSGNGGPQQQSRLRLPRVGAAPTRTSGAAAGFDGRRRSVPSNASARSWAMPWRRRARATPVPSASRTCRASFGCTARRGSSWAGSPRTTPARWSTRSARPPRASVRGVDQPTSLKATGGLAADVRFWDIAA